MNLDDSSTLAALDKINGFVSYETQDDPHYKILREIAVDTIEQATEAGADFDTADDVAYCVVFAMVTHLNGKDPEPYLEQGRKMMADLGIDFPLEIEFEEEPE